MEADKERINDRSERYRKFLVAGVKAAGQMMIDNAEDIVGHTDNISNFSVTVAFDQALSGSIPELQISRAHMPRKEIIEGLWDVYYGKNKQDPKELIISKNEYEREQEDK